MTPLYCNPEAQRRDSAEIQHEHRRELPLQAEFFAAAGAANAALEVLVGFLFAALERLDRRMIRLPGLVLGPFGGGQQGLERQADPLGVAVEGDHLHFDFLAFAHHVAGTLHAAVADFGDVNQALDAGIEFHEGAELHQLRNRALHAGTDGELLLGVVPGIGGELAVAERDLAGLLVDLFDLHLHGLANREHILGMRDAVPTQLAHVDHAVDAAEIDERAEVLQAADGAFANLARGEFGQQLLLLFLAFALHQGAMAEHQILAAAVGFGDDASESLADELFGVLDAVDRNLAHRNETADAGDLAFQAALVRAGDGDFDDLAFLHFVPIADVDRGVGERQVRRILDRH